MPPDDVIQAIVDELANGLRAIGALKGTRRRQLLEVGGEIAELLANTACSPEEGTWLALKIIERAAKHCGAPAPIILMAMLQCVGVPVTCSEPIEC